MGHDHLTRRDLLRSAGGALALATIGPSVAAGAPPTDGARLPRWRGFNLVEKIDAGRSRAFRESDFAWMAGWGFDFARLPLSYRCWSGPDDWLRIDEAALREVDDAVEFGRRHGIHVSLNLHRAPGYCVNPPGEPLSLWDSDEALEACCAHWAHLARRYRGRPSRQVSFNLLNEPPDLLEATYVRVVGRLVEAIRAEDPDRLVIADGLRWGRTPVPGLAGLGIAQSARGYDPFWLSHFKAPWLPGSDRWLEPRWPWQAGLGEAWDRDRLQRELVEPWQALERGGVGVHVGEWGAYRHTPHATRHRAGVDERLARALAPGGLGLGAVELPGGGRRARQRSAGRGVRGLPRPPARPGDARAAAGRLTRPRPGTRAAPSRAGDGSGRRSRVE